MWRPRTILLDDHVAERVRAIGRRRPIGEVKHRSRAVGQTGKDLPTEFDLVWIAKGAVWRGEENETEWDAVLQSLPADNLKVFEIHRVHGAIVHQRVVVEAD